MAEHSGGHRKNVVELLPKNIANTAGNYNSTADICYLNNIHHTKHPFSQGIAEKQANETGT